MTIILTPGSATLGDLELIWRSQEAVKLHHSALSGIKSAAALVAKAAADGEAVYGVNTGFGELRM